MKHWDGSIWVHKPFRNYSGSPQSTQKHPTPSFSQVRLRLFIECPDTPSYPLKDFSLTCTGELNDLSILVPGSLYGQFSHLKDTDGFWHTFNYWGSLSKKVIWTIAKVWEATRSSGEADWQDLSLYRRPVCQDFEGWLNRWLFFAMCKTNTESQEKLGNRRLCSKQGDVSPESDLERWI